MRKTPSIRTLAAIAYERGEEFDPALMLSPALAEQLDESGMEGTTVFGSSSSDARRFRHGAARSESETHAGQMPAWFEAGDLVPSLFDSRHGEPPAELV